MKYSSLNLYRTIKDKLKIIYDWMTNWMSKIACYVKVNLFKFKKIQTRDETY